MTQAKKTPVKKAAPKKRAPAKKKAEQQEPIQEPTQEQMQLQNLIAQVASGSQSLRRSAAQSNVVHKMTITVQPSGDMSINHSRADQRPVIFA